MKRFTKGQVVFQACRHFAENDTQIEMRVISRTVDACGAKQVTFEDHGMDSVYGRRDQANSESLHASAESAFAQLEAATAWYGKEKVINPSVLSDRDPLTTLIVTRHSKAA